MREEKIYECEVKRRRIRAAGGYEPFWKVKTVAEALIDGDTEFRCKHCHGEVKLHKRAATQGGGSHVTHKSKSDSEHCCDAIRVLAAETVERQILQRCVRFVAGRQGIEKPRLLQHAAVQKQHMLQRGRAGFFGANMKRDRLGNLLLSGG